MKPRIAVLWFPGTNCEEETVRAVAATGMEPTLFRWNRKGIEKFDGYVLPGGWSYEDRVRAGVIAARDPIVTMIKEQAVAGKPVLGICNGAQIVVEAGMVPGLTGVDMGLGQNTDGYYCVWTFLKHVSRRNRSVYTRRLSKDAVIPAPIAHGEGRFTTTDESVLPALKKNNQILFQYCTADGKITDEANPNGSTSNIAGVCNKDGNVLALMPHPERAGWHKNLPYAEQLSFADRESMTPSMGVFTSMREFLYGR